jgi:hypothetical protein
MTGQRRLTAGLVTLGLLLAASPARADPEADRYALVAAAITLDLPEVKELLARGVSARADDKFDPLDGAVSAKAPIAEKQSARREIVHLLLRAGADPNRPAMFGGAPLEKAIQTADAGLVKILVDNGADFSRPTSDGKSLWALAGSQPGLMAGMVRVGFRWTRWQRFCLALMTMDRVIAWILFPVLIVFWVLAGIGIKRTKQGRAGRSFGVRGDLPRIAPVHCKNCGAVVPLRDSDAPCPSCGVSVPADQRYAEAVHARREATQLLTRATARLRIARVLSSPLLIGLCYVIGAVLLPLAMIGMLGFGWDAGLEILGTFSFSGGFIGALIFGLSFVFFGYYLYKARESLYGVPALAAPVGDAETGVCGNCGADISFARGQLAVHCLYCGDDNLRPAVVAAQRAQAMTARAVAAEDLARLSWDVEDIYVKALTSVVQASFSVFALLILLVIGGIKSWLDGQ